MTKFYIQGVVMDMSILCDSLDVWNICFWSFRLCLPWNRLWNWCANKLKSSQKYFVVFCRLYCLSHFSLCLCRIQGLTPPALMFPARVTLWHHSRAATASRGTTVTRPTWSSSSSRCSWSVSRSSSSRDRWWSSRCRGQCSCYFCFYNMPAIVTWLKTAMFDYIYY